MANPAVPPGPRRLLSLLAVCLLSVASLLCGASLASAQGELSPSDEEILVKVRLAGLWEGPISQLMFERSTNPKVKDVGKHLSEEHAVLDGEVQKTAAQVGVSLPSQPTAQQQGWMDEISGKTGADADRTYVNLARAAHGTVFPLVSTVRATTKNDAVRSFAQKAVNAVMRHMTLLESTGLARADSLTSAPAQSAAPAAAQGQQAGVAGSRSVTSAAVQNTGDELGFGSVVLGVLAGLVAIAATLGLVRWFGAYRRGSRHAGD
ncbi:DUF4142 domain-containing protein [Amycolatopsis magusensis]|uniref:Outer membrane protein n=1 Tax=Amycolatopsis magusensis TaxID=882444 RepID=A0ABS4PN92_9PSEU|nr:DUF4142 domain-containing protein [Amycolatopsis magusensis]MBP2180889.1 putative outer membrane protein [Amycolatopsis magusensis]MDI5975963.1 DUF4142 domain-containing protein [Amycolatopsis magusensis]